MKINLTRKKHKKHKEKERERNGTDNEERRKRKHKKKTTNEEVNNELEEFLSGGAMTGGGVGYECL